MTLTTSRVETSTGLRIHFDGYPEPSRAPHFCEGHPAVERDHELSARLLPLPFAADVGRRWHINGAMTDTPPRAESIGLDEDEEMAV